ncbi:suppressor of cytokine signaling 3-like [Coregonus clupeaformis]|uniref:suppressor of cytokine signaling 3-like n=1 Tax=Coregonus clupeaformis TaxID=59861 RepID=UPI001E1C9558|nr:suppressor of cytokine signaling 3-like [Coregonus clupeaformis]
MVTHSRHDPPAMSSVTHPEARGQESDVPSLRYKPFSSRGHYQQVLCAVRKLQESGFYWGAVGGREASALLRSQPPGTFLVRDSSDHHYFFTLSVQTSRGTKNLRIHSQGGSFYLQPDPCCTHTPPRFDCVLKLIGHYMGKEGGGGGGGGEAGGGGEGEAVAGVRTGGGMAAAAGETVGTGSLYLIHSGGEKVPLELSRPLPSSLSSLQHLCRRTLNGHPGGPDPPNTHQLPHTLRDFLAEYDAPI